MQAILIFIFHHEGHEEHEEGVFIIGCRAAAFVLFVSFVVKLQIPENTRQHLTHCPISGK